MMKKSFIDDLLESWKDRTDYRFFFDALNYIGLKWQTDDLHYSLYRFLRHGDRRHLLEGILRGSIFTDEHQAGFGRERPVAPRSRHYRNPYRLEQYQDVFVNKNVISDGLRECKDRYKIVKGFLSQFQRPFSVLDMGANLGYFSLNIASDFDAVCFCVENVYGEWLNAVLEANASRSIFGLHAKLGLDDLKALSEVEHFDVILALSVLHHIDANVEEVVEALRSLADYVIIEFPTEVNACGDERLIQVLNYDTSALKKIGEGASHLGGDPRPIFAVEGHRANFVRPYLASQHYSNSVELNIDLHQATITKMDSSRNFIPGMNAHTFLYFGGFYPRLSDIVLDPADLDVHRVHADLTWWNVILSSKGPIAIDFADQHANRGFEDNLQFVFMKNIAKLCEYKSSTTYTFKMFGLEAKEYLAQGWHETEFWGTWSAANCALIILPSKIVFEDISLRIFLRCCSSHTTQHTILVNGNVVWSYRGDWSLGPFLEIVVPSHVWNISIPLFVEFLIEDMWSPAMHGLGPDGRQLGIGVESIQIT